MIRVTNAQLNEAKKKKVTVRLHRSKLEPGAWINGFVVDYSDKFILLEEISGQIHLDGYSVLRRQDVTRCQNPNPRDSFYRTALHMRGERRTKRPKIELKNVPCILDSVSEWPLVSVHRELIKRNVCFIGRIVELAPRHVVLDTIDIHAKFDGELETFKYSDITRIDFGNGYETALALVAGLTKDWKVKEIEGAKRKGRK